MSSQDYFEQHSPSVRLGVSNGLRRGQLAAIHALVGHLSLRLEPAIVVLPTGAGKTDVAILLPYLLRPHRVLVVVPSDAVRTQVADRFESLALLKSTGVLAADTPSPKVMKLAKRLSTLDEWNTLRAFDVVVTTAHSISPLLKGVLQPPESLFDLLLIDEAHHSPAKTWQSVLDAFPHAKRALFTATPFRRDKKQIKGVIVANYLLRDARADGVFGDIRYEPVTPEPGADSDEAIAVAVAAAFAKDRHDGFDHAILVRAASVVHADALLVKYGRTTSLKLEVIHSKHSAKTINSAIQKLRSRYLDGLICVDMLGEGFDFPNFKIAALHAPHASLGITLQFIGRFARVGNSKIGPAHFFAVPSEIEGEMEILFRDESVWQDLIVNLSEARITQENDLRSDLATFDEPEFNEMGMDEVSLYALRPNYHVKVYSVPLDIEIDLSLPITLPTPFEVMYRQHSEELATVVLLGREQQKPRWSDQLRFGRTEYDLFTIHFDRVSRFLFINSSRRADSLYRHLAHECAGIALKGLPLYKVNRTLAGLKAIECFSVGMKNRLHSAKQESYRMLAGHNAHQAIRKTDGRLFHQGHIACTAINESGTKITLGYSSGSKLWSSGKGNISVFVRWCGGLARKMESTVGIITAPGLDILTVGVPLTELPDDVFAVDWDPIVYEEGVEAHLDPDSDPVLLMDFSLRLDAEASSSDQLRVVLEHEDAEWSFDFSTKTNDFFTLISGPSFDVSHDGDILPIAEHLSEYPLYFYCTSLAKLKGEEYFPCSGLTETFSRDSVEVVDWAGHNVDIRQEFWKPTDERNGKASVHEYLCQRLVNENNLIVFYDHRSGEAADYLTVTEEGRVITITLFHCKGAGGLAAGDRIADVSEVCSQVVKSFNLVLDEKRLMKHMKRRSTKGKVLSCFEKGSVQELERIFRDSNGKKIDYSFAIVQPGVSQRKLGPGGLSALAAELRVIGSA
jgi:superfamily II DNA or RNA helicase